ncbi:MAG: tyrosine--tRNA ligase [Rickettsiales bacterium]|nr:tyrosine--tRNA ligase [Pseudomonadota bacterium]MDA0967284.1 tyrosine--tRNA ligase [Pseudomonadota bacterium]MDG4544055.1 tyrosine--tRNA ligase [Rickettsiales bacterium]MDG4546251.1 tyrosine--tRNA ligase [Rickettsiales bacterium]MDG4548379.1 tyrosine--tRNA ligase [Rickettsiales bacterium]
MAKSEFFKIFNERGFFHQCTDEDGLDKLLSTKGQRVYIGFDCTATSLHVGSLIQIMILRWLQKCGHKPIVLLGGGTTKVGDPSGKDETRKLQTSDSIRKNMDGIKSLLGKFIKFGGGDTDAILVNNDDWLGSLKYIDFLRDIGSHFSVNRMLSFESVKMRLDREQNLSFLEFNYMILQAYDFVELYNKHGCRVQIGGSDQWGNIINGIDLQKRLHPSEGEERNVYGLTTPLITTASGAKMGKTAQGAVWLTEDMVSPYDYWQFWRNTEDKDVGRFLRLFTELDIAEIEKLEALEGADINSAKIVLANEATKICHGEQAAKDSEETARKTFEQGGIGDSLPVVEIAKAELEIGIPAFKILMQAGLADSGKAAKRLIQGGGAKINDNKIEDEMINIGLGFINSDGVIKLSSGKKKHALVKAV